MKRLVLLGGGHSHVEVLRRFGSEPVTDVELVLVSPYPDSPYSGMLPGWIAGHYTRDECHIDLARLTRFANCRFVRSACNGINPEARLVFCEDGTTLPYDVVSVDTGARSPAFDVPGAPEHALPVKPVEQFMLAWAEICKRTVRGQAPRRIAVAGGGAAGVEVLLAMQYQLHSLAPAAEIGFELVSDTAGILVAHTGKVRTIFMRVLEQRCVTLHLGAAVERVDSGSLRLCEGGSVQADTIVWATGASAPLWPRSVGLATDERGFILVNQRLQSVSHPQVFASGDMASVRHHPRPKSGVYAVRAGPPLAENLRRSLKGEELVDWRPQREALALISTGDRYAVASRGDLALEGQWVWRWKNWIDRRFVGRYKVP
ncbi:MAG TPA: FAD-dependent oxidoreductase [Burkholderiales bacterium]|nr:FAD-dependent oxidoreductase [Burkholderiales bacterium]